MDDRIAKMEEFLQKYATIFKENPTLKIDEDFFYTQLMYYGMSQDEVNNSYFRENFNYWENHFATKENITVYVDERQKKFCQFQNNQNKSSNTDWVKMYLSFSKEDTAECVKEIFDFIEANGLIHASKVGERQRADSVILRLENIEDAKIVQNFITSSPNLSSKARDVNPFLYNQGKVGYALDGLLSYNGVLSNALSSYYNEQKNKGKLDNLSLTDFRNYIVNFYNETFSYCTNLENFTNSELFEGSKSKDSNQKMLCNYEEVYKLIISATDKQNNFNNYVENFSYCKDEVRRKGTAKYYDSKLKEIEAIKQNTVKSDEINAKTLAISKDIFDTFIKYAIDKYGVQGAIDQLNMYYVGANLKAITRDIDFRTLFSKYVSKESIKEIIMDSSIKSYVSQFKTINKAQLLEKASKLTFEKHGYEHLKFAIIAAVNLSQFSGFSEGDDKYRTQLINHFDKDHIRLTIEETLKLNEIYKENEMYYITYCDYIESKLKEINNNKVM